MYIVRVYSYFSRRGIVAVVLRDMLACDYISTNSSGKLPAALKIYDARYKNALRMLEENPKTRSTEGVKRGVVLLYSENSIAYSDYVNRNPATREFALRKVPLSNV